MDLLGWIKCGKYLKPDPHRQNVLLEAKLPITVKDLRSYVGTYRTFYRCKNDIAFILEPLEQLMANKPSSQKLIWTPELINQFEVSHIDNSI